MRVGLLLTLWALCNGIALWLAHDSRMMTAAGVLAVGGLAMERRGRLLNTKG